MQPFTCLQTARHDEAPPRRDTLEPRRTIDIQLPREPDTLRVLWLIRGLGAGGAEQLLVQSARFRDRSRFDLDVAYTVPGKRHLVPALQDAGVRVHTLSATGERAPVWLSRLWRILRQETFHIVHSHSPLLAGVVRVMVQAKPRRLRPLLVYTEHNRWDQYRSTTRLLNRVTYRFDDATLAVSDGVRESVSPSLQDRVMTLHHGIDLDHVRGHASKRAEARTELGLRADDVAIGIVANLRREKAYQDLLAAARQVVDRADVPVRFFSVGQGPLAEEMQLLRDGLGLRERFEFLGYREDVLRVMAAFDVFALSSHFEGLPVAVMEAQALGLPIAATSVGGLPEAVEDGHDGLLVPPREPGKLADALIVLAEDPALRASMGDAARERSGRFDARRATASIQGVYEQVVCDRRQHT